MIGKRCILLMTTRNSSYSLELCFIENTPFTRNTTYLGQTTKQIFFI